MAPGTAAPSPRGPPPAGDMARINVPVPKVASSSIALSSASFVTLRVKNTFLDVESEPDDEAGSDTRERRPSSLPPEFKLKEPSGEMTYHCLACRMMCSSDVAGKLKGVCCRCKQVLVFIWKTPRLKGSFNKDFDANEDAPELRELWADVLNRMNKVQTHLEGGTVCLSWKLGGMDCKSHFRQESSSTHVLSHWIEDVWFFYGGQFQVYRARIGLYPIEMVQGRGGSSFRKSGGRACLKVFLEGHLPEGFPKKFRASISVGGPCNDEDEDEVVGGPRNDADEDEVVSFTQSPVPFFESAEEFYIPNALEIDILGRMSLDISVQLTPA
mmetsp:Transcript_136121/g.339474  ORF Transcript_136121/g.339474 Transcript_136121/m.339474 type:complete len:327 (+) Transcript_136121:143-1123(+)